jgi:hypothetical protein
MMGHQSGAQDKLFYSFSLDDHVPLNHLCLIPPISDPSFPSNTDPPCSVSREAYGVDKCLVFSFLG